MRTRFPIFWNNPCDHPNIPSPGAQQPNAGPKTLIHMAIQDPRIRYGAYNNANDSTLPKSVDEVVLGMKGNEHFVNPPFSVEDIATALANYRAFILPPGQRTSATSDQKDAKKAILVDLVVSLGKWVEMVAMGDLKKLRSSGFELVERTTVTELPGQGSVKEFRTNGSADSLDIQCVTEPNTKSYEAHIWYNDRTEPLKFSSTTAKIKATGLPQGVLLTIQVRRENVMGLGAFSPTYKTRLPMDGEVFPKQKS